MNKSLDRIIAIWQENNILCDKGLSSEEIIYIEKKYKIQFPLDLKDLLSIKLPISKGFIDWRSGEDIEKKILYPYEGLLFDMRNNNFWNNAWGDVEKVDERERIFNEKYKLAPKLIPIYGNRYISSEPLASGNPIFSIHQSDIIIYGENLLEYFKIEFKIKSYSSIDFSHIKKIDFWSNLLI